MALLTRLTMLVIASPILWLADIFNFSIDLTKSITKKNCAIKTVLLLVVVLAIIHFAENACGELNELYFELLKMTWLSLKITGTSTVYLSTSVLSIFLMHLLVKLSVTKFFNTKTIKVSPGAIYSLPGETFNYTISYRNDYFI